MPRLRQYADETHEQQAKVGALKDAIMKLGANLHGLAHAVSSDEVLKHALARNEFEHLEAASYCSLAAAANDCGEPEIARTCEDIMKQELAMADWVFEQLSPLTNTSWKAGATSKS